jgi:predicted enzyme related to lactoylglutathione lyase
MQKSEACRIEWLLIPAPDLEKGKDFYCKVFGFRITDYNTTFAIFKAGNISGGLDSGLSPSSNSLSFSITVEDIPMILNKIVQYQGKIIREKYSLGTNLGFCAQFADPNGNVIELYSAK